MNSADQNRLGDIFEFAAILRRYVVKGYEEFLAEDGSGLAIERLIELVGEASNHLSEDFKAAFPSIA